MTSSFSGQELHLADWALSQLTLFKSQRVYKLMGIFSKKTDSSASPASSDKSTPSLLDRTAPSSPTAATNSASPPTGFISGALATGERGLGAQGAQTLEALQIGRAHV